MNMYEVAYGNGYMGSRDNLGTRHVLARSALAARRTLSKRVGCKVGHTRIERKCSLVVEEGLGVAA